MRPCSNPLPLSILHLLPSSILLRLVSTSGYVVVDDTHHPQFDDSEWPWVINQTFLQPDPSSCSKVQPLKVWICVTLSQDLLITKLPDHLPFVNVCMSQRRNCGSLNISEFDCIGKVGIRKLLCNKYTCKHCISKSHLDLILLCYTCRAVVTTSEHQSGFGIICHHYKI